MRNTFNIDKKHALLDTVDKFIPLYDIDSIVFKNTERRMLSEKRAYIHFLDFWKKNDINIDLYKSSNTYVGPFSRWEYLFKYKLCDNGIRNLLNTTIDTMYGYDMDFTFESSSDAEDFFNYLKQQYVKNKIEKYFDSSIKIMSSIISKSCVSKLGPLQQMCWINTIKLFMKEKKTSIQVDLMITPDSIWYKMLNKHDWIVCDNNSKPWIFSNTEYLFK